MSTFWHSTTPVGFDATRAGGEASLPAIFGAAMRQMWYVDNLNAREVALDEAIDRRNAEVFAVTGTRPRHPFRGGEVATREEKLARWQREVEEASRRIPDTTVADRLNRSIEADALRIAREAEQRLGTLSPSRPGFGGFLAEFGGAMVGALRDPLIFASLGVGFGPGAGRTLLGRMFAGATREALVNAGLTAAAQPTVQAWREKAGLPAGEIEAIRNVAFAAVLGGAFGAGGVAIEAGAARLTGRALDAAAAEIQARPETPGSISAALAGDVAAAREVLPEIRDVLPAAARGALDHAEQLDHLDALRPAAAAAEHHDVTVSAAHRAIEARAGDADAGFSGFPPDPAQVARITDTIVGAPPAQAQNTAKSLVEFLIDRGGLADAGGDLRAIGATEISRRFRGRLVREGGAPLDLAREAAEEAGYLGRAGEMQTSTVADLLDAIDQELRGQPVFSRADMDALAPVRDWEAARAGVESAVHDVARMAGPAVDDRFIRAAAELAIGEKMDPGDALERVLTRAELAGAPAAPARAGDILPGWSDAELEQASAARGNPPNAEADGLDRPADVADDLLVSQRDSEDLAALGMGDLLKDIERDEDFAALVKACRT